MHFVEAARRWLISAMRAEFYQNLSGTLASEFSASADAAMLLAMNGLADTHTTTPAKPKPNLTGRGNLRVQRRARASVVSTLRDAPVVRSETRRRWRPRESFGQRLRKQRLRRVLKRDRS